MTDEPEYAHGMPIRHGFDSSINQKLRKGYLKINLPNRIGSYIMTGILLLGMVGCASNRTSKDNVMKTTFG